MAAAHLPLAADPANRYLAWLIALMVYLAALALALAFVLDSATTRWTRGQSDRVTVQLAPPEDGEETLDAAVELLHSTAGIAAVRPLTRAEQVALLEPWLGKGNVTSDLPLPRLIDVELAEGAPPDLRALELRLGAVAPGTRVDDHGYWLGRLATTARSLQLVALAVVLAIGGAAVGTIVFTTRTSLAVHRETVELLHLIGAQDGFVARAFERQSLRLGLHGGLIGLGLAVLTFVVLRQVSAGVETPLLPRVSLATGHVIGLAALPLASALIAMVTARLTVLKALARMP